MKQEEDFVIQSLERAFGILELLDRAELHSGIGVQDISNEVGLKLPTVHNMLKSLTLLGYVAQDVASGKYRIGDKLRALGMRSEFERALSEVAEPLARKLNKDVNEIVTVTLYANCTWHTLFQVFSEQELSVRVSLSVNNNMFISATGRCILSRLPKGELEKYLKTSGMPGEALDEIKKRGHWHLHAGKPF
jgi:DNA-binding IclR family transcriptional regulator